MAHLLISVAQYNQRRASQPLNTHFPFPFVTHVSIQRLHAVLLFLVLLDRTSNNAARLQR